MILGPKGLPYYENAVDAQLPLPDPRSYMQTLATAIDVRVPQIGKLYIPTQETVTSAAYTLATTPDRIQNIVLPTDGLLAIGFSSLWKASAAGTYTAGLFLGATQCKLPNSASGGAPTNLEVAASPGAATGYTFLVTNKISLSGSMVAGSDASVVTTGMVLLNPVTSDGGLIQVWAAAGTYDVSIQWKNSAGTLSIKERRLWVHAIPYS